MKKYDVNCSLVRCIVKWIIPFFVMAELAACSLIEVKTKVTYQVDDRKIPENIINATLNGKTDKTWLIDHIGYPDIIVKKGSSREDYIYKYSENREAHIGILFLYSNEYTETVNINVVFELKQNVVQNYWIREVAPKWNSPTKKLTDEDVIVLEKIDDR